MVNRDERIMLSPLGEWYRDLLVVDSWINNRPKSQQATSLLCAKMQEREAKIQKRLEYLARKRGITAEELWIDILQGNAERLPAEEWAEDEESE
ncbi:MAG: hypothetical protein AB4080_18380 [Trichodesmium sp.]